MTLEKLELAINKDWAAFANSMIVRLTGQMIPRKRNCPQCSNKILIEFPLSGGGSRVYWCPQCHDGIWYGIMGDTSSLSGMDKTKQECLKLYNENKYQIDEYIKQRGWG